MTERNPIAPRLRPGEVIPQAPEGKVPTRHYGEIVFISAPTKDDIMYNNSPYTVRQVYELEGIRAARAYLQKAQEKYEAYFGKVTLGNSVDETVVDLEGSALGDYLDYKDLEPDL